MSDERPETCICPHKTVKTMGILYGVPLMGGTVRIKDDPKCPIHGRQS